MLINPFMSCSARLPVYVLITGAFFPEYAATVMFSIYIIGILLAAVVAIFFKKTIFRSKEVPFVMELPPYRLPTLKAITRHMWNKAAQYIKKMGGVILIGAIIIWALGYFPRDIEFSKDYNSQIAQTEKHYDALIQELPASDTTARKSLQSKKIQSIRNIKISKESERQEKSYIGLLGKSIEPIIKPLGFDWRMGVSLVSGIAAKEIVVSTIGVLFQAEDASETDSQNLQEKLKKQVYTEGPKKGQKVFTPIVAFAFLIFILVYFPCIAVIAAVRKESGSWKWALFLALYTTALAWLLSFIVYQVGSAILS
jgi:ferrous iron transport protein B